MSGQSITIVSGIILLLVFALVGWKRRRQRTQNDKEVTDA